MTPWFLALKANAWKIELFVQMENSLEGKIQSLFLEMVVSDVYETSNRDIK